MDSNKSWMHPGTLRRAVAIQSCNKTTYGVGSEKSKIFMICYHCRQYLSSILSMLNRREGESQLACSVDFNGLKVKGLVIIEINSIPFN